MTTKLKDYNFTARRQYYAAHAPIDFQDAQAIMPKGETKVGEIMSVLAEMRFSYADAMLKAEAEKCAK